MTEPRTTLMSITGGDRPPTLGEAAAMLGVAETDLRADFGVVAIDPARRLYAVELLADRVPETGASSATYGGPFSNPQIAPFGPVQEPGDDT